MRSSEKDIDQGYAWVVLTAAFCIQMIAGILTYSPGVINIAILEEVENDLSKTSWIGSALFGTFKLLGPVAGLIQNRVGSRVTALAGGILTLMGLTAASFCKTVTGLILTYGLLTGFGICLGGNVVGVVPGQYFIKRRPIAYGICMSGGAMGLFISGPLTRYLLAQYGIDGTLLLLGAVSFHMCITGVIFRNRGPVRSQSLTILAKEKYTDETNSFIPMESKNDSHVAHTKNTNVITEEDISMITCLQKEEEIVSLRSCNDATERESPNVYISPPGKHCIVDRKDDMQAFNCISRLCGKNIPNLVAFIIYNVSVSLWSLGESACIFHLPNYAEMKGSSLTQAANLFTAIGAGGLVSRTATGMIASDSKIGYTTLHVGLVGISGILTLLFPLYSHTYSLQLIYSILYGIYNQGVNSLMAPITIDLIGLPNIAIGFGVVCFSCGTGYFLGPPVASFLFKVTGSYDFTFIFTGICLILSSVLAGATSIFKRA